MMVSAAAHVATLALSAVITAVLTGYAFRRRREPGALPFAGLMLALTVWSTAYVVGLVTLDPDWRPVWEACKWFGTASVPVWFALFALEYTGHDETVTWRTAGLLSVVPLATVALVWTNPVHGLFWSDARVVVADGVALMDVTFGPWFWVNLVYAYALIALGAALILRLVLLSDYLYADQSALLLVGVATPLVGNAVSIFTDNPALPGIDLTPYAFIATGLAFGYALFSRRLFDLVPATRQLGRDAAIRQLDDGVVIVDTARQVIYCNPAAADLFECDSADALGRPITSLVDESALDFDTEDALAELAREDGVYEVRTSPIHDRRDRPIGHTLVIQDVTARKRRERRLERRRDELARLDDLNEVIRGVNRVLVSATSREEIERAVCDHLADGDLYRTACAGDVPTWNGDADRWTVAGADEAAPLPAAVAEGAFDPDESPEPAAPTVVPDDRADTWTVVPIAHGRTVYGALALCSRRERDGGEAVTEREREVLGELGGLIGHAIDAVENRRLLAAESIVELSFRSRDDDGTLLGAASAADCRLDVTGFVPDAGDGHVAFVRVEAGSPGAVADHLAGIDGTSARLVRESDDGGLVEWTVTDETLVGTLADRGANLLQATAEDGASEVVVEVAAGTDVRALVDRIRQRFPETRLETRREHDRPIDRAGALDGDALDDLTDRQRDALEAAYRAGYFDWPRESTAEEVAETLDIAASTLHGHLRKAESRVLADLFDPEEPVGE